MIESGTTTTAIAAATALGTSSDDPGDFRFVTTRYGEIAIDPGLTAELIATVTPDLKKFSVQRYHSRFCPNYLIELKAYISLTGIFAFRYDQLSIYPFSSFMFILQCFT